MAETAAYTLADHIAHLVERLVEMARVFAGMPQANRFVAALAWGRMRRLGERFARLKARLAAGTLRPPRARGDAEARAGDAGRERVRRPPLPFLPRSFGWFARMVPGAGPVAQDFERLLAGPEMPVLMSAAPQAGRILRPLAHMLGIRQPAFLRLPRRTRAGKREGAANAPHPPASRAPPPGSSPGASLPQCGEGRARRGQDKWRPGGG
jgi:hypothetical protein